MCVAYVAANIRVGFLAHLLAYESESELENYLISIGMNSHNFVNIDIF